MSRKISAILITFFGILVGILGLLFKVMHWPGNKIMTLAAIPIMMAGVIVLLTGLRKDQ